MATAVDKEGLTPLQLMGQLQRSELRRCREALQSPPPQADRRATTRLRPRQTSFGGGDEDVDFFSENGDLLQNRDSDDEENSSVGGGVTSVNDNNNNNVEYACEVVTFGRPDHYALGV
ncbi:MAG: hypothetical protein SGILL_009019, partial [Bacillariaceae sp.]